jgi:hypothetical protein
VTSAAWFVGGVQFVSRKAALEHIGERSAELTEIAPGGGSSVTVSVHTEHCEVCGAGHQVIGVMGALRTHFEGRPCGCWRSL